MKLAARCCSVCYPPNRNAHVQSFSQQAMSPQVFFFLADRQLSVAIGPHRAIVADAVLEFVVLLQIGGGSPLLLLSAPILTQLLLEFHHFTGNDIPTYGKAFPSLIELSAISSPHPHSLQ